VKPSNDASPISDRWPQHPMEQRSDLREEYFKKIQPRPEFHKILCRSPRKNIT
jgi:hypothetical protein